MKTEIAEYSPTEAALADLRQRYKDVVFDVATTKGMEAARKGRAEIVKLRTALEAKRVEIKAPALERCRLIDAEAKRITAELLSLEQPIDALIKTEERRKAEEKAERERIERERIERIQSRIAKIGSDAAALAGKSSQDIEVALRALASVTVEWADEFKGQATDALNAANQTLVDLHAAALANEAEQTRLKAEREELARLRAEQQKREREEAERAEAARKQREAEERQAREKIEAEQREARERIAAQEREAKARIEAQEREARQKREAEEAEARRRQAEEDERLRVERERIEAERREIEAQEREAQRQRQELMDGYALLRSFVNRFGRRKEFSALAKHISEWMKAKEAA